LRFGDATGEGGVGILWGLNDGIAPLFRVVDLIRLSLALVCSMFDFISRWVGTDVAEKLWRLFTVPELRLVYPELLLLALPVGWAYWRWGRQSGVTGAVRVVSLLLLVLAAAGPTLNMGGEGLDLVVVVDRSRSLPEGSETRIKELIGTLEKSRGRGDRLAIITFGAAAQTEQTLSEAATLEAYRKEILPDGSDLGTAIEQALDLVKDGQRPARVLVFSDGEANGAEPGSAARRARDLGVPLDFREFPRVREGDIAVESLQVPDVVAAREPFQYSVNIQADRAAEATVTLFRNGKALSKATRTLSIGRNRLLFRDILEQGGLTNYEVRVEVDGDPIAENNRGTAVTKVEAGPRMLVLNSDGQEDNFVRAIRSGLIPVDVAPAESFPLNRDSLDRYRAVVLENVPAGSFGRLKMEQLAQYVEDLGGGLWVTGGRQSFGTGGYFNSPLDELLPVSMEMREEHRKTRIAIAIALDRSGSMAVTVAGGRQKMDLANLGTAECIKLLSPGDSVAVIAVDSSPHVVQPLTDVDDVSGIVSKVTGIQSMGGGIFVYEALVAAGEQLANAEQSTKHIILFSDANDSEEPGDYRNLLDKFEKAGITTSVIGLGKNTDVDAKLLEEIASLGKGNIMFTEDAEELPRLFTEDTMSVARSSFIEPDPATQPGGIPGQMTSQVRFIGELTSGAFPKAGGYNLTYLRPDATMGVVSGDEYAAPWSAYWYRGLGRVAALTLEVDGKYAGGFGAWPDYADFCITHARWLMGGEAPGEVFVKLARAGQDAVVTLELDESRAKAAGATAPTLLLVPPGDGKTQTVSIPFQWRGPQTLEARYTLGRAGAYRSVVVSQGKKLANVPAITLPYSPEFMPRTGLPAGRETLIELSELTAGKERTALEGIYADAPRSARRQSLIPLLLAVSVGLLVTEIAGRRLSLWSAFEQRWLRRPVIAATADGGVDQTAWRTPAALKPKAASVRSGSLPRPNELPRPDGPATTANPGSAGPGSIGGAASPADGSPPPTTDVFARAKEKARRKS
jgi:Mg-chelatase subunit ChlD